MNEDSEAGFINGVPVWVNTLSGTLGERTVIKEAPGINGAVVETQAQAPERFQLEVEIIEDGQHITDDWETASLEFRTMILLGGPFTLTAPTFGEVSGLYMDGPATINYFDKGRLLISSASLTLIDADPFPILQDSALKQVDAGITALSKAVNDDFVRRSPDLGFTSAVVDTLTAGADWLALVKSAIDTAFQPVNSTVSAIRDLQTQTELLLAAPGLFVSQLMQTAMRVLGLIPDLARGGDPDLGSAAIGDASSDKPKNVLVGAANSGADYDEALPPTPFETLDDLIPSQASEEDEAEQDTVEAARSVVLSAVVSSIAAAATRSTFSNVNSVVEFADAFEAPVERLLNIPSIDYRVYQQARNIWRATTLELQQRAATLPRIRTLELQRDTDVFDILPDLYGFALTSAEEVQQAVDTLASLNSLQDPLNIPRGFVLSYLDRPGAVAV